jgi:hypothetical protein
VTRIACPPPAVNDADAAPTMAATAMDAAANALPEAA